MAGGRCEVEAEVVIVGAGIAGLATALALHRAGVGGGVLVLERYPELRATGAALTIFPSGWFALRTLGVAHKLMSRYDAYEKFQVTNLENGATQVFRFTARKNRRGRRIERRMLEALAEELPSGTVRFSSNSSPSTVRAEEGSPETSVLRLDDGTVIRAKVLIGCDGVHSVVAQWLGLSEPVTSGRSAVRGLAVYPDGHGMKKELRQFLSAGLRASRVPISQTEVYWFLVNNTVASSTTPSPRHNTVAAAEKEAGTDPTKILREVTDNLATHMLPEYLDTVRHSDHNSVSWAPLLYRSPWAILTGPVARGSVMVAGDAFHPMTPDLAQGGCSALEDAVCSVPPFNKGRTPMLLYNPWINC